MILTWFKTVPPYCTHLNTGHVMKVLYFIKNKYNIFLDLCSASGLVLPSGGKNLPTLIYKEKFTHI